MDYRCEYCKYETNCKRNYNRHLQSTKHIYRYSIQLDNNAIDNLEYNCIYCKRCFQNSKNLGKHLKSCSNKKS